MPSVKGKRYKRRRKYGHWRNPFAVKPTDRDARKPRTVCLRIGELPDLQTLTCDRDLREALEAEYAALEAIANDWEAAGATGGKRRVVLSRRTIKLLGGKSKTVETVRYVAAPDSLIPRQVTRKPYRADLNRQARPSYVADLNAATSASLPRCLEKGLMRPLVRKPTTVFVAGLPHAISDRAEAIERMAAVVAATLAQPLPPVVESMPVNYWRNRKLILIAESSYRIYASMPERVARQHRLDFASCDL